MFDVAHSPELSFWSRKPGTREDTKEAVLLDGPLSPRLMRKCDIFHFSRIGVRTPEIKSAFHQKRRLGSMRAHARRCPFSTSRSEPRWRCARTDYLVGAQITQKCPKWGFFKPPLSQSPDHMAFQHRGLTSVLHIKHLSGLQNTEFCPQIQIKSGSNMEEASFKLRDEKRLCSSPKITGIVTRGQKWSGVIRWDVPGPKPWYGTYPRVPNPGLQRPSPRGTCARGRAALTF